MRRKVFQINKRSTARKIKGHNTPMIQSYVSNPFPEIKPVQGIMPDSKEEYWVALALYKLKIDFQFQYQLWGGRKYKGGQVVDFWVYTVPLPTPLLVQGWYFHYGSAEKTSETKMHLLYLESRLRGKANKPIEIIDKEIPTPEDTYRVVRQKLRGVR